MVQVPESKGKGKKYSLDTHCIFCTVLEADKLIYKDIIQWNTLAPWPFPIFCATTCLSMQQSHTLKKVQGLADGDFDSHLFQEMLTQVTKP
jgi:hypothetical protein